MHPNQLTHIINPSCTQNPPPFSPPPPLPPANYAALEKCIALLRTCNSLPRFKQIHAHSIRKAVTLTHRRFAKNLIFSLVSLSSSAAVVSYAAAIFSLTPDPDVFTFNTIIRAHACSPSPLAALAAHRRMVSSAATAAAADSHTYPFLLKACARLLDLRAGETAHARAVRDGLAGTLHAGNALVAFYGALGQFEHAYRLFDEMPHKNLVSWNAAINAFAANARPNEALTLFHQMAINDDDDDVKPDGFTMVSMLTACAELGALALGRRTHTYLIKMGFLDNHHVGNSLVDLYAKCGGISDARRIFHEMGSSKNVVSWTSLIVGLAMNGCSDEALEVFANMERENLAPTEITFVGVLYACSHSGLVDKGFEYFNKMRGEYSIPPKIEHYGCIVDLLGRAGLVERAREFIEDMPVEPNAVIWRTLLGACAMHKKVSLGELAWARLRVMDPGHSGDHVLLSNLYASVGQFELVQRLRRNMLKSGVRKSPGHSLLEVRNRVHEFVMGDRSHPRSEEIFRKLEEVERRLRSEGYEPRTAGVTADIEEEEKGGALSWHSERLAVAFALIETAPGVPVRVVKNLRICVDCHLAIKLISRVYGREIVVRDRSRFHHFKDGLCSCKDYW